jgi:hypothetical protein
MQRSSAAEKLYRKRGKIPGTQVQHTTRLVMRAPGLFDPGVVPRIHAGPFRKLTRNGKVIGTARLFLKKSLAVPLGVDSRVNPRALRPGAAMTANGNCCTCVPGLLPQLRSIFSAL